MFKRYVLLLVVSILGGYPAFSQYSKDLESSEIKANNMVKTEKATFAGGCFWCMQPPFDQLRGVISTIVGYTGGPEVNPTYKQVAYGRTGHAEAIEVIFDPSKISYAELLDVFWRNINPTQRNGQFVDKGSQYRSEIFYHNDQQKRFAEISKEDLGKSGRFSKPIVTEITPSGEFYPAEEYHQKYYKKNPYAYKRYRIGSGRDNFLKIWDVHVTHVN